MRKILCVVLVLLISLAGCKGEDPANEDTEMPEKEYIVNTQYKFSDEEVYLGDVKIADMIGKNKEEIFQMLGDDYELVYGWADSSDREGYGYPNRGIRIFFTEWSGSIESINCNEKAAINGVKLYMPLTEAQNILGEGEITDFGFEYQFQFILSYRYKGYGLHFSLSNDDNRDITEMDISFGRR